MQLSRLLPPWPFLFLFIAHATHTSGTESCTTKDAADDRLTVTTLTGRFTGLQNPQFTGVREFRNIPYAEPPVGRLRWMPPVPLRPSRTRHAFSRRYSPPCPQYLPRKVSVWNEYITDFRVAMDGNGGGAAGGSEVPSQSLQSGDMARSSAEDCLGLAIWTPLEARKGDRLPVALFVPGGSFRSGGVDVPYQIPAAWVNRSQKHVVVTMNWRTNIFGFPNAAGLEEQNLGTLDQRIALEWTYANIAAFGGDPDRIVLWGHSAGAVSADILNFAYPDDPLVSGFFLQSGTAMRPTAQGGDALQTNFSFVARELGCDFATDPVAEVECMRQVPVNLITKFVGELSEDRPKRELWFRPTADDKVVFKNYTERAEKGLLSKLPALITTTSNEQSVMMEYPEDLLAGPNKTEMDEGTLDGWICKALNETNARDDNGLVTYRYLYAGNYSSLAPLWWMGAYHASDVPMIFGTYNRSGLATDAQRRVAETMQDYVFAFLANPVEGLRTVGWMPTTGAGDGRDNMVLFGAADGVVVRNVSSWDVDAACLGEGVYVSNP